MFEQSCHENSKQPLSRTMVCEHFETLNLAIYRPQKRSVHAHRTNLAMRQKKITTNISNVKRKQERNWIRSLPLLILQR